MEVESMNPVILGILSSLIATFIFISCTKLFFGVVLPWYEDKIYRGVRIDGKWDFVIEMDNDDECVLNLKQSGDVISGTHFHSITIEDNRKVSESYHVKGNVKDGYFFATFDPISKNIVDSGTIHMKIYKLDDKLCMKGSVSGVSSNDGKIIAINEMTATKCG